MFATDDEHIPPHRAWAIQRAGDAINEAEHAHLLECGSCINLLRICALAESFGAAVKVLNPE
jgi:hypothetical protein